MQFRVGAGKGAHVAEERHFVIMLCKLFLGMSENRQNGSDHSRDSPPRNICGIITDMASSNIILSEEGEPNSGFRTKNMPGDKARAAPRRLWKG